MARLKSSDVRWGLRWPQVAPGIFLTSLHMGQTLAENRGEQAGRGLLGSPCLSYLPLLWSQVGRLHQPCPRFCVEGGFCYLTPQLLSKRMGEVKGSLFCSDETRAWAGKRLREELGGAETST